jgi:hypothetical protein
MYNILELKELKSIIEDRLSKKRAWVNDVLGEELLKRISIYNQDDDHDRLERINNRIEEIIKSI